MSHEAPGESNEWYTPAYIFEALGCEFDLDVACPKDRTFVHVPAAQSYSEGSLEKEWFGFVWMNPPFGNARNKQDWLEKFFTHGNGVALTPDRTCTKWFHYAAQHADAALFTEGRVSFIRPDGSRGGGQAQIAASGQQALPPFQPLNAPPMPALAAWSNSKELGHDL